MRATYWSGPAWRRWGLALALGGLASLGQAPLGWALATLLALAVVLWLAPGAPGWRQAAWFGWFAGTGHFLVALSWIVEPFLVDIPRHGWMAPFGLTFMAGGLALFWAAAFGLAARFGPVPLALALGLAEFLRGIVLSGFPWAQPGHVLIDTPLAHLARIVGAPGLTFLILLVASLPAALSRRPALGIGAMAATVAALWFGTAAWSARTPAPPIPADAPMVRLVQPNAPQDEKWAPGKMEEFYYRSIDFTAAGPAPDLVVWPETSVPVFLDVADPVLRQIASAARGAPSIVGIQRRDWPRFWNSLVVIDGDGAPVEVYDKHHLVPFGEYVPFADLMSRVGIHGLAANEGGGYTPGPGGRTVEIPGLGPALALICYEGIFPEEIRRVTPRARMMVLITNDAWFGEISGPYQHLVQARLRAIEMGLPMIRVANTGISAMIDSRGTVTASIPLGEAGWLDAALPPALPPPVYARHGDWPVLVAVILALGLSVALARRRMSIDAGGPSS